MLLTKKQLSEPPVTSLLPRTRHPVPEASNTKESQPVFVSCLSQSQSYKYDQLLTSGQTGQHLSTDYGVLLAFMEYSRVSHSFLRDGTLALS